MILFRHSLLMELAHFPQKAAIVAGPLRTFLKNMTDGMKPGCVVCVNIVGSPVSSGEGIRPGSECCGSMCYDPEYVAHFHHSHLRELRLRTRGNDPVFCLYSLDISPCFTKFCPTKPLLVVRSQAKFLHALVETFADPTRPMPMPRS